MSIIYEPTGRALDYSLLACNLFEGCKHGCTYCYAPRSIVMSRDRFIKQAVPRHNILERLRKDAPKFSGTDKRVLLCFTCDPYQPIEVEQKVTRKALQILREFRVPFQVLTKGGTRAVRDFDLYSRKDAFATTMTFMNFQKSKEYEPNAALPDDRCEAIMQAHLKKITTWVSLEPVIDADESLEVIKSTQAVVDLFKIGKLNYAKSEINWRRFGIEAIELCEKYSKLYYIKHDLAEFLEGVDYTNTDTRRVKAAKGI